MLDAVLLRTELLSLAGRNALEIAAVAGQRCVVANVPSLERADGLGEALASGLLVEDGPGRVAFRHALVRDAIYHAVPWTRRRSLHAAIAAALEEAEGSPAERARHWLGAATSIARSALAEAAAASAAVYAYRDAAELYERALDLDGGTDTFRFELLERLAVCAELAGDLAGSARAWREVIDGRRGRARWSASRRRRRASAACSRCAAATSARWWPGSRPPRASRPAGGAAANVRSLPPFPMDPFCLS